MNPVLQKIIDRLHNYHQLLCIQRQHMDYQVTDFLSDIGMSHE
jgi:hypothetical protein